MAGKKQGDGPSITDVIRQAITVRNGDVEAATLRDFIAVNYPSLTYNPSSLGTGLSNELKAYRAGKMKPPKTLTLGPKTVETSIFNDDQNHIEGSETPAIGTTETVTVAPVTNPNANGTQAPVKKKLASKPVQPEALLAIREAADKVGGMQALADQIEAVHALEEKVGSLDSIKACLDIMKQLGVK